METIFGNYLKVTPEIRSQPFPSQSQVKSLFQREIPVSKEPAAELNDWKG